MLYIENQLLGLNSLVNFFPMLGVLAALLPILPLQPKRKSKPHSRFYKILIEWLGLIVLVLLAIGALLLGNFGYLLLGFILLGLAGLFFIFWQSSQFAASILNKESRAQKWRRFGWGLLATGLICLLLAPMFIYIGLANPLRWLEYTSGALAVVAFLVFLAMPFFIDARVKAMEVPEGIQSPSLGE